VASGWDLRCADHADVVDAGSLRTVVSIRRVVPDIQTDRLEESREFYTKLIGLETAMDLGWIVTLISPVNETSQLSLLSHDETAPVVPNISIEVDDVDSVYAEALRRGEKIIYPLTDEPWGLKRFFVEDPNGIVINVLSQP
jgi:catechol 2,3-dioxygenase-like lactoylglutathione lyase family enzyme